MREIIQIRTEKERDDIAELTVNMDVRVFCKDDKPSDIKVGTIKADKPSSLRLADLANVIGEDAPVRVVYQTGMGTAVNISMNLEVFPEKTPNFWKNL